MQLLQGRDLAERVYQGIRREVAQLSAQGITPALAVVLVGEDPASKVYVARKQKICRDLGILSQEYRLPASATQAELLAVIERLNGDSTIHGILCQAPMPPQIDHDQITQTIAATKDVDCFHPYNLGLLFTDQPRFLPCTPLGVLELLRAYQISTEGKEVVIVGRSNIVGRPLALLLTQKEWNATVTVCHSKTRDLERVCQRADILISAIGKPQAIGRAHVRPGAIVIDVGINQIQLASGESKLVGDVHFDEVATVASAITPVPGGAGQLTIAMLMVNTINAARLTQNWPILAVQKFL